MALVTVLGLIPVLGGAACAPPCPADAAGALEAAFCWLSLRDGRLPPQRWDGVADPGLPRLRFTETGAHLAGDPPHRLMSSSFAFGGNNACLILGDAT